MASGLRVIWAGGSGLRLLREAPKIQLSHGFVTRILLRILAHLPVTVLGFWLRGVDGRSPAAQVVASGFRFIPEKMAGW